DDDVDRDPGCTKRLEDGSGDSGAGANTDDGDLRDVLFLCDPAHALSVFPRYLRAEPRTDALVEARSNVDGHSIQLTDLHRARMQDLGAAGRELQHLVVLDVGQLARFADDPRVGG